MVIKKITRIKQELIELFIQTSMIVSKERKVYAKLAFLHSTSRSLRKR